jgi:hypothetical protein
VTRKIPPDPALQHQLLPQPLEQLSALLRVGRPWPQREKQLQAAPQP